jgi:hypothetical protein
MREAGHMARTGDRFKDLEGGVVVLTRSTAETGGEYVEIEMDLPPGWSAPPPHTTLSKLRSTRFSTEIST